MSEENKEQAERVWREQARGRAYWGVESAGDDVESNAELCQDPMGKVLDPTAKTIMICAWSKRWWTGQINQRRSQLGGQQIRRRRSVATAQAMAELHKSIQGGKGRIIALLLEEPKGSWGLECSKVYQPTGKEQPWRPWLTEIGHK